MLFVERLNMIEKPRIRLFPGDSFVLFMRKVLRHLFWFQISPTEDHRNNKWKFASSAPGKPLKRTFPFLAKDTIHPRLGCIRNQRNEKQTGHDGLLDRF